MATTKVRNVSGQDLLVPLPSGEWTEVPANHQYEFDTDHARSLLDQPANWERVKSPDKPAADKDKE